jgi:hypothetical protein
MVNARQLYLLKALRIGVHIQLLTIAFLSYMVSGCCKHIEKSKEESQYPSQNETMHDTAITGAVHGQVVDENGKPLAETAWKIIGTEELLDGKWTRMFRLNWAADNFTDAEGRFVIPFLKAMRYDLQFHKPGFAPTFVYEVGADFGELKVTLKQGEHIHGSVVRLVDGIAKPAEGETVELCLPGSDLWYQEKVSTDANGKYEFRACTPPSEPPLPAGNFVGGTQIQHPQPGRKWQLVYKGKTVQVDVNDGKDVEAVDFTIENTEK